MFFVKDPDARLGSGPTGTEDIKSHPFFKNIDWMAIYNKKIKPPFIPKITSDVDTKYVDSVCVYFISRNLLIAHQKIHILQERALTIMITLILVIKSLFRLLL
jgi:hypothetical protein